MLQIINSANYKPNNYLLLAGGVLCEIAKLSDRHRSKIEGTGIQQHQGQSPEP